MSESAEVRPFLVLRWARFGFDTVSIKLDCPVPQMASDRERQTGI